MAACTSFISAALWDTLQRFSLGSTSNGVCYTKLAQLAWFTLVRCVRVCLKLFFMEKKIKKVKYILSYCCILQMSVLFTRVYFGRPERADLWICLWVLFPSMFAVEMISIWSLPIQIQKSGSHDLFRSGREIKMWPKHHSALFKGTYGQASGPVSACMGSNQMTCIKKSGPHSL